MTHTRRRLATRLGATLAATAAAITIGLTGPAHAQTWDHEDATGDTWRMTSSEQGEEVTPAPDATETDIATVTLRHGRRVVVRTTGVDYTRETGALIYEIRAGRREVWVEQRAGSDRSFAPFVAYGDRHECRGARGSVDRSADLTTVSVPRRCLGRPDLVRVGVGVLSVAESTRRSFAYLADDGLRDGPPQDELRMSDRVPRGRGTVG